MAWYKQGTIAISGKTVTGTGTTWTDNKAGIGAGQALLIPGTGVVKLYEIARVNSATSMTLDTDAGTVPAGSPYAIMSFYTESRPDFNRRLAAQLAYYQSQMDGWQNIMTGSGSVTIEAPDGTTVTISSFKKLTADVATIDGKAGGVIKGNIYAPQGNEIALISVKGGAKNIAFQIPVVGDGDPDSYVNRIIGQYYTAGWQLGAVRGQGTELNRIQLYVDSGAGSAASFQFMPSGVLQSNRFSFKTFQTSWDSPGDYGMAGLWGDYVSGNDGGWVPALSWATVSTGGYPTRATWGLISGGNAAWPTCDLRLKGDSGSFVNYRFLMGTVGIQTWSTYGQYDFAKNPICDRDAKKNIVYTDGEQSYKNIRALDPVTFIYKNDDRERIRRGVIAQDAMKIDPEYVTLICAPGPEASKGAEDVLSLDANAINMDVLLAVHYMADKIGYLEERLAKLETNSGYNQDK